MTNKRHCLHHLYTVVVWPYQVIWFNFFCACFTHQPSTSISPSLIVAIVTDYTSLTLNFLATGDNKHAWTLPQTVLHQEHLAVSSGFQSFITTVIIIIYPQGHSPTMPLLANAKDLMILWLSNFKMCAVTAPCNSHVTAMGLNKQLIVIDCCFSRH